VLGAACDALRRMGLSDADFKVHVSSRALLSELLAASGIPAEKVAQYLALIPEVCSLDTPVGEDSTLQGLMEDTLSPQPQEEMVRRELKRTVDTLLGALPEREQQVLRLRFGMEDGTSYSLEKVGQLLGISKERARQLQHQALERMQKMGESLGLEDFLE